MQALGGVLCSWRPSAALARAEDQIAIVSDTAAIRHRRCAGESLPDNSGHQRRSGWLLVPSAGLSLEFWRVSLRKTSEDFLGKEGRTRKLAVNDDVRERLLFRRSSYRSTTQKSLDAYKCAFFFSPAADCFDRGERVACARKCCGARERPARNRRSLTLLPAPMPLPLNADSRIRYPTLVLYCPFYQMERKRTSAALIVMKMWRDHTIMVSAASLFPGLNSRQQPSQRSASQTALLPPGFPAA